MEQNRASLDCGGGDISRETSEDEYNYHRGDGDSGYSDEGHATSDGVYEEGEPQQGGSEDEANTDWETLAKQRKEHIQELEKSFEEFQQSSQEFEQELETEIQTAHQDLENAQKQLEEYQQRSTEAEERADEAEAKLRKLNAQQKALQEAELELHNCQQKVMEKDNLISQFRSSLKEAEKEIDGLKEQVNVANKGVGSFSHEVQEVGAERRKMQDILPYLSRGIQESVSIQCSKCVDKGDQGKTLEDSKPLLSDSLNMLQQLKRQVSDLEAMGLTHLVAGNNQEKTDALSPSGNTSSKASLGGSSPSGAKLASIKTAVQNKEEYEILRKENAALYSKLLRCRGNILVVCRVRPFTDSEVHRWREPQDDTTESDAIEDPPSVIEVLSDSELGFYDSSKLAWRPFVFDKVLPPQASQAQVVQELGHLVQGVLEGYNACVFAYGITGSGKTHSMSGPPSNPGLILRMVEKILSLSYEATKSFYKSLFSSEDDITKAGDLPSNLFKVQVSIVEIYNEEIRDLLGNYDNNRGESEDLDKIAASVEQSPPVVPLSDHGAGFRANTSYFPVSTTQEMQKLLHMGFASRATAATNIHEHSSRSHLIVCVDVKGPDFGPGMNSAFSTWAQLQRSRNGEAIPDPQKSTVGRVLESLNYVKSCLYLVDLAGSERVRKSAVTGARLREAQHINRSLSALGDVLEALDKKASHIPYRNSKLSYLLQDALGGNARTAMLCNVGPSPMTAEETLYSLQFASRTRRIDIKPAQRMVEAQNVGVECRKLRKRVAIVSKQKESAEQECKQLKERLKKLENKLESYTTESRKDFEADKKALAEEIVQLKEENAALRQKASNEHIAHENSATERLRREAYSASLLRRENEHLQARVAKLSKQLEEYVSASEELQHHPPKLETSNSGTPETARGSLRDSWVFPSNTQSHALTTDKAKTKSVNTREKTKPTSALAIPPCVETKSSKAVPEARRRPATMSTPQTKDVKRVPSGSSGKEPHGSPTEDKIEAARRRREQEKKKKVEAIKRRNAKFNQSRATGRSTAFR
eukprot:gb/GECG01008783.1/.p1 GENE.gb/GECG01008783.1/~~gb/GECG01008783.1/.p1  ORF type:complete len:1043 (+),score=191.06 gb/GECG01008783.1/:1-3129(+)